jgi:hypothetical protein
VRHQGVTPNEKGSCATRPESAVALRLVRSVYADHAACACCDRLDRARGPRSQRETETEPETETETDADRKTEAETDCETEAETEIAAGVLHGSRPPASARGRLASADCRVRRGRSSDCGLRTADSGFGFALALGLWLGLGLGLAFRLSVAAPPPQPFAQTEATLRLPLRMSCNTGVIETPPHANLWLSQGGSGSAPSL